MIERKIVSIFNAVPTFRYLVLDLSLDEKKKNETNYREENCPDFLCSPSFPLFV